MKKIFQMILPFLECMSGCTGYHTGRFVRRQGSFSIFAKILIMTAEYPDEKVTSPGKYSGGSGGFIVGRGIRIRKVY